MYQRTTANIDRRSKAIAMAIRKYNGYCKKIRQLSGPAPTFPLPQPLLTEVSELRKAEELNLDIWIGSSETYSPSAWLTDPVVHDGVRK